MTGPGEAGATGYQPGVRCLAPARRAAALGVVTRPGPRPGEYRQRRRAGRDISSVPLALRAYCGSLMTSKPGGCFNSAWRRGHRREVVSELADGGMPAAEFRRSGCEFVGVVVASAG
jgi:hypothetical protein